MRPRRKRNLEVVDDSKVGQVNVPVKVFIISQVALNILQSYQIFSLSYT